MAMTMSMMTFATVAELQDYLSEVSDDLGPFGLITHGTEEEEMPEGETEVEEGVPTAGVEAEEYYPPEEEF